LEVALRLERGDAAAAGESRREYIQSRWEKHPRHDPSAGSYFQNLAPEKPEGRRRAAGELLDRAGVKSLSVGGAAVYHKHANIIINTGGATSRDVLALADRMKRAVREKYRVELQEEVRYLPWQLTPAAAES
jgi:UDP-N-acetylmuramate dehydrogenase